MLLLEDDRQLRTTLRESLVLEGYHVFVSGSLADARAQLAQAGQRNALDLVIFDLGLPDGEGEDFLQELRAMRYIPAIVISARHGEDAKVRLLDAGADDYLVKPFSVRELFARIRLAMRRRGSLLLPAHLRYECDGLVVDLQTHQVALHGISVHLTPTEFKLLTHLVRQAGQVVTHRQLLARVWGSEFVEHTHYLRLYMAQLRAKLEEDPAQPRRLLTEIGIGYRLADALP